MRCTSSVCCMLLEGTTRETSTMSFSFPPPMPESPIVRAPISFAALHGLEDVRRIAAARDGDDHVARHGQAP